MKSRICDLLRYANSQSLITAAAVVLELLSGQIDTAIEEIASTVLFSHFHTRQVTMTVTLTDRHPTYRSYLSLLRFEHPMSGCV